MNVYFSDTITVRAVVNGTWGGNTYAEVDIKGRFEHVTKMVRDIKGEHVVSSAQILCPLLGIEHKDKIVYNGIEYNIIGITVERDFSNSHMVVYLQ